MANFTYFIRERVKLNGRERGTTYEATIEGINFADNRVMQIVSGSMTEIINIEALTGAGTFVSSSLKYARFSNLSTGSINVQVATTAETFNFLVTGSGTFTINSALATSAFSNFTYNNVKSVKASPVDSNATIGYFVATT